MSKESITFNVPVLRQQAHIHDYECFGWELLSVNGESVTMSRETQTPVYSDLVKYQVRYEELTALMKDAQDSKDALKRWFHDNIMAQSSITSYFHQSEKLHFLYDNLSSQRAQVCSHAKVALALYIQSSRK